MVDPKRLAEVRELMSAPPAPGAPLRDRIARHLKEVGACADQTDDFLWGARDEAMLAIADEVLLLTQGFEKHYHDHSTKTSTEG